MRWNRLAHPVLLLLASVACQRPASQFTDAERRAVTDSVRAGMQSYADAVQALDPMRILGHYVPGADFRLVSDGTSYSYTDMQALADGLSKALRASEITWDSVSITPLSADAALAVAPFHRTDTDAAGTVAKAWGVASWVWVRRDGHWRMLYGHGDHYPDTTTTR